jgi:L-lactate utilization protein LutB
MPQHFERSEAEMIQEVVAYIAEFPFLLRCVGCCKVRKSCALFKQLDPHVCEEKRSVPWSMKAILAALFTGQQSHP